MSLNRAPSPLRLLAVLLPSWSLVGGCGFPDPWSAKSLDEIQRSPLEDRPATYRLDDHNGSLIFFDQFNNADIMTALNGAFPLEGRVFGTADRLEVFQGSQLVKTLSLKPSDQPQKFSLNLTQTAGDFPFGLAALELKVWRGTQSLGRHFLLRAPSPETKTVENGAGPYFYYEVHDQPGFRIYKVFFFPPSGHLPPALNFDRYEIRLPGAASLTIQLQNQKPAEDFQNDPFLLTWKDPNRNIDTSFEVAQGDLLGLTAFLLKTFPDGAILLAGSYVHEAKAAFFWGNPERKDIVRLNAEARKRVGDNAQFIQLWDRMGPDLVAEARAQAQAGHTNEWEQRTYRFDPRTLDLKNTDIKKLPHQTQVKPTLNQGWRF